jgi:hypothetical protein
VSARKFRAVFSKRVAMAQKRFKLWKKQSVVFQQQSSRARSADASELHAVFAWGPLLGMGKHF